MFNSHRGGRDEMLVASERHGLKLIARGLGLLGDDEGGGA